MNRDINVQFQGRWASVLNHIGIDRKILNGKHQACIYCGGRDRARWHKKKEYYLCNQCGVKQPIDIAMDWLNLCFKETAFYIRNITGNLKMIDKTNDVEKNQLRIDKIRKGLKRLKGDCLASRYLASRGLRVLPEKDVFFNESVEYWQDGVKSCYPAMVAIVRNSEGKGATLHITYLTHDGKKIDRKVLPLVLPLEGCSIQMFEPDGTLGIAEGIETSLALYQLEEIPVWSAGNAWQMSTMSVPDSVHTVIICPDYDEGYAGEEAAYILAKKLKAKGKKVGIVHYDENGKHFVKWQIKYDLLDCLVLKDYLNKSVVRQQTPIIADALNEITQGFGKPAAVQVKNNGQVIYSKGELLP